MDLDGFKEVNDTLGHQAGDEVIRAVAERLAALAVSGVFVARIGGDEFAMLTEGNEPPALGPLAERIREAVRRPAPVHGIEAFVSALLGAARFPEHGTTSAQLLLCADLALYDVKRSGRGSFGHFTESLRTALDTRKAAVERVRHAAMSQRLLVHYQPQVSLDDGAIRGLEAMVRIANPDGSVSDLSEFGLASEDGDCARLSDTSILAAVLRDLDEGGALRSGVGSVSVNLSAHSLHRRGHLDDLLHRITGAGTPLSRVQFEVQETALAGQGAERLESAFGRLHMAGVRIALDSCGTGLGSLTHLRNLPISWIKLDGSLLAEQAFPMLRLIVELAHALGIKVGAKGVETSEAADRLRSIGCDEAQGWPFGRPQPADTLVRWLQERVWAGEERRPVLRCRAWCKGPIQTGRPSDKFSDAVGSCSPFPALPLYWQPEHRTGHVSAAGPLEEHSLSRVN